jgi:hypothetical protein
MAGFGSRPPGFYAVSVITVAVLLMLAMVAMLCTVLFVVHAIATTL